MKTSSSGYSLVELLIVLLITTLGVFAVLPSFLELTARTRVFLAANELVGVLRQSRSLAVRHNVNVGLKFHTKSDGTVTHTRYRDGDGDGLRSDDIRAGRDPQLTTPRRLQGFGSRLRFGFPPGPPPRDPGDPSRRLDRLEDPIRFNSSDLASFTPVGTSTPGTLYITDSHRQLAAVRVYGRTGKVKVLLYDQESETWR